MHRGLHFILSHWERQEVKYLLRPLICQAMCKFPGIYWQAKATCSLSCPPPGGCGQVREDTLSEKVLLSVQWWRWLWSAMGTEMRATWFLEMPDLIWRNNQELANQEATVKVIWAEKRARGKTEKLEHCWCRPRHSTHVYNVLSTRRSTTVWLGDSGTVHKAPLRSLT